jgi:SH3 domain protein
VLRLLLLSAMILLSPSLLAQGQSRYISDDVFIYLLGGPSTEYRIIGSIEAGQPVTLLPESENGYSKIVDHKGREGWVASDMLSDKPSFRQILPQLQSELAQANARLETMNSVEVQDDEQIDKIKSELAQARQALDKVSQERDQALADIAAAKQEETYRMWREGGLIAAVGALLGVILVYLPRPQRRRKNRWM